MYLDDEIAITRTLFRGDMFQVPARPKQIQKLMIIFREAGINGRLIRMCILQLWVDDPQLKSSKDLTLHVVSKMIDYLCDQNGWLSWDGALFLALFSRRAEACLT